MERVESLNLIHCLAKKASRSRTGSKVVRMDLKGDVGAKCCPLLANICRNDLRSELILDLWIKA